MLAQMYVLNCIDVMNEVLDSLRDLHSSGFVLCEEYIFETGRLLFVFPFLAERVVLRSMQVVFLRLLLTLQLSVFASRQQGCVLFVTHGIAGSTGISIFFLQF